ncbi:MAG: hypothetical protein N4A33_10390 [Bacteriovoracaceae bacterium]|jgi:YbbR domain-containing protein|nr:hypothetical protein [Bacteriovoracaceae bacterium]
MKKKHLLKVVSVIFAFTIWFYIRSSTNISKTVKIPIQYITPIGYEVEKKALSLVKYKIIGPRAVIDTLDYKNMALELDIDSVFKQSKRKYKFSSQYYNLKFPFSVKVMDVSPKNIKINIIKTRQEK